LTEVYCLLTAVTHRLSESGGFGVEAIKPPPTQAAAYNGYGNQRFAQDSFWRA
jgi:hypothetical protein